MSKMRLSEFNYWDDGDDEDATSPQIEPGGDAEPVEPIDPQLAQQNVVQAFYACASDTLSRMVSRRAQLLRMMMAGGKGRLRITVDLSKATYVMQHVIEASGARHKLSDGYPKGDAQQALCEAVAPFVQSVLNDPERPVADRVKLLGWLADGRHYLRVHCDIAAAWRIVVALREIGAHVKGETAIAVYTMASPTSGPQVLVEGATVH